MLLITLRQMSIELKRYGNMLELKQRLLSKYEYTCSKDSEQICQGIVSLPNIPLSTKNTSSNGCLVTSLR